MEKMEHGTFFSPIKKFSLKEYNHYSRYADMTKFKTPEKEWEWALTQTRKCSKCEEEKCLTEYTYNTSGRDPFDKKGYRARRPECSICTNLASKGKSDAKKRAKELGIPHKAPEGTLCGICNKLPRRGDELVFDHCHCKNIFRGYAHNSCNRAMGILGDDVEGLLRSLNYLLKTEPRKIKQGEDGVLRIIK